jgi:hypothetical protein
MRVALSALVLLASTPVMAASAETPLSIHFVDAQATGGGEAWLGLGRVSARSCGFTSRRRCVASTVTRRRVGVRVEGAGRGFVRLQAYVPATDPRVRVRVGGVLLGPTPQLIDPGAPLGVVVHHVLELEVPASEPPGRLETAITWVAETDR